MLGDELKHILNSLLIFIFFVTSALPAQAASYNQSSKECENGECVQDMVQQVKNLSSLFKKECLPPKIKENEIESYIQKNNLTETCWKYLTQIKHLDDSLSQILTKLENKLGCETGECKGKSNLESLNFELSKISKVQEENACTESKKKAVRSACTQDMTCALMATAAGGLGYLAELIIPKNYKPVNCNLGDDSCTTQLVTGFVKAAFTFFESLWDLGKIIGSAAKKKVKDFWNWATNAEDHSSTAQLSMAQASEDPGVFSMLINDFSGTMKNIWQALVASIKEWLKTDIFCAKWEGVPHFSKCQEPMESFDCLSCKAMINGTCALTGEIIAEVIPAFFTGGLTTAAKYGASGASKIAKLFKVSSKTTKALKSSTLGKKTLSAAKKTEELLKTSKALMLTKNIVTKAIEVIKAYTLSPLRKLTKTSLKTLSKITSKSKIWVAETKSGKVLILSAEGLKKLGKVVIYPIDNPLIVNSFKAGQRSFDKLFKYGTAKISGATLVTQKMIREVPEIESKLVRLQKLKNSQKPNLDEINKLEREIYDHIALTREKIASDLISNENIGFNEIINDLYPELKYNELSKNLGSKKVIEAEKDLFKEIGKLPEGKRKDELTKLYLERVSENSRGLIVTDSPHHGTVIKNSKLSDEERISETLKTLDKKSLTEKQKEAVLEAHLIGENNGVYEYSWRELRHKHQKLVDAGFTESEADLLIRNGIAGRPPVRTLIEPGETLFSGFASDILEKNYLTKRETLERALLQVSKKDKKFKLNFLKKDENKLFDEIESIYFIDHQHNIDELMDITTGKTLIEEARLTEKYGDLAFNNFKNSRAWLLKEKPEISRETLVKIHEKMLKDGVENAVPSDFGHVRNNYWSGNIPHGYGVEEKVIEEFKRNPYLLFEGKKGADGLYTGRVWYPNAYTVRKEALDLIKDTHPKLYKEILETQEKFNKGLIRASNNGDPLTKELVEALTDQRMDWYNAQRKLVGVIDTPEKLDEFINVLANFQRDLVSIHPVANGNGRSTRELMNYILMKEGFPPARIIDTNADIYRSVGEWREVIKKGILASDQMVDDLLERVKFDLPLKNSFELITPYQRPAQKMTLKDGKKVLTMEGGEEYIDPKLYREVIKKLKEKDSDFVRKIQESPIEAWEKIDQEVSEVFQKNNIYYKHPKKGLERLELGFVDDDFKYLFGKASFNNQELFDFKMKSWYTDEIGWRGLASRNYVKSEEELLEMFKELSPHMASNSVLGKIGRNSKPDAIKKAALADFEKYNEDVFGKGLVQMAKDHSETGPMYGISYGYSTSKDRKVGKAFSMGAMVVADYGKHMAPEAQALLKQRVLVGARRSVKDVDLGRLKQMRPEFSYKYGRQQEVMGIGAADPDAVTIIQTIKADGSVDLTYLRNPKKADEIWIIKGDIAPDEVPTSEQLIKTVKLK